MDFLSANSGFGVQNDGTFLPQIMRETCISIKKINKNSWSRLTVKNPVLGQLSNLHFLIEFLIFLKRKKYVSYEALQISFKRM